MKRYPAISVASVLAIVTFFVALIVYASNRGNLYAYDSAPNSLLVFNAIDNHTLAFDAFRGSYLYDSGAGYTFVEAPNGHLEPIYPIGPAILSAPIYIAEAAVRNRATTPPITASAFEPIRLRDEKRAAVILGALAAALFALCALRFTSVPIAIGATVAFAFGSAMWTIGSQALWQQGSVALVTLAMILALGSRECPRNRFFAGLCAGFLPAIRPTAALFSLVAIAETLRSDWPGRAAFAAGFALGVLPLVLWNGLVFHSFVGGYAVDSHLFVFSGSQIRDAFLGLLVSPNRGLVIFTPFVIVSLVGAIRVFRIAGPQARSMRYLALASAATFGTYLLFSQWHGGSAFGPRYLTEILPFAGLALAFALPAAVRTWRLPTRILAGFAIVTIVYGVAVQTAGAFGEPFTNWSGVPTDLSTHTERVWDGHDGQIVRDARATAHLWLPNPTAPNAYARAFDGTIATVRIDGALVARPTFAAGTTHVVDVTAKNTGSVTWYGYRTGLYFGQARIRVRFLDAAGATASEQVAYFDGAPKSGQTVDARAEMIFPKTAGIYRVIFDIDAYQDARIGSRHVGAIARTITVSP